MTILLFLFFLSLLIFFHELGHFFAAKKLKAIVEEFSLGFPPRIFSRKIKGTNYSIGLILFGGYVKLKGEDDPNDREGFLFLPAINRFLIVISGVIFNIFLAYLLFSFSLLIGYPTLGKKIFVTGFLNKNSLAAQKLKIGDEIISYKLNDQIYQFKNLEELSKFIQKNKGKEVEITFKRDNLIFSEKFVLPAGFYISNFELIKERFPNNFYLGFLKTVENFKKIIFGFFKLISSLWTKEKINLEIVGPIGIYSLFDNFKNFGLGYLFYFIGILSLNLVLINAFPFPALDGGRAILILFEIIFKKRLDLQKEEILHRIGFTLLFILLLIVTFKDIYKLWLK